MPASVPRTHVDRTWLRLLERLFRSERSGTKNSIPGRPAHGPRFRLPAHNRYEDEKSDGEREASSKMLFEVSRDRGSRQWARTGQVRTVDLAADRSGKCNVPYRKAGGDGGIRTHVRVLA